MNALSHFAGELLALLAAASVKSGIVLLIGWAAALCLRRASAHIRHRVWLLSVAAALVVPMLDASLPSWRLPVLAAPKPMPPVIPSPNAAPFVRQKYISPAYHNDFEKNAPRFPPQEDFNFRSSPAQMNIPTPAAAPPKTWNLDRLKIIVASIWSVGAFAVGMFGAIGGWLIRRLGRRATPADSGPLARIFDDLRRLAIRRPVQLLLTDQSAMPMTWGILRPRILLPREAIHWPQDQQRSVLLHELAHVYRWDCATQLLALLTAAIYWFNPLAWLAATQMRIERERSCDDFVLGRGASATQYAQNLLGLARRFRTQRIHGATAVAMARRSGLADRIRAILGGDTNRTEMTRRATLISAIVVLALLVPLSALHLKNRPGKSGAAMAAETSPATKPSADAPLPPIPTRFSSKRVAIQVLSPTGQPMPIDSIQAIYVWIPDGKWMDGPTPQVLARYADGWVFVDKEMFILAQPGERVDLIFISGGSALTVSSKYPAASPKKITFNALNETNGSGVDTSAGPAADKNELAGEVVGPDGKPIAGAVASFGFGGRTKPVTTGADGIFRFPGLDIHRYVYLHIEKPGYATRNLMNVPIGRGFLVHMDSTTRIRGQFIGSDGLPAADAKIDFVTSKPSGRADMAEMIDNLIVSAATDAKGSYDIPVEPGEYEIRVSAPNGFGRFEHINVASGQIVGISEKLTAGATLKIVAIDTITQKPAAGVKLYIWDQSPGMISERRGSERTTDANGTTQWQDLMPGPLQAGVQSDFYGQWWTDEMKKQRFGRYIDSLQFNVTDGMQPVTVNLEPAVHVAGIVTTPDGKPAANVDVNIGGLTTGDNRYHKTTDAKGAFTLNFPILKFGGRDDNQNPKYAIVASDPDHRWANAVGDWFTPSVGQSFSRMNLAMTAGGRLRGRVVGSDGKPVAKLLVRGQAADGLDCSYYDPWALTDEHGRFELAPLRAATYSVFLAANEQDAWRNANPASLTQQIAEGDRIEVGDLIYNGPAPEPATEWGSQLVGKRPPVPETDDAAWQQAKPAITPIPAPQPNAAASQPPTASADEDELLGDPATQGELSGKVVDVHGQPIAGVSVHVWTWTPDRGIVTDGQGKFSVNKLPANRDVEIRFSREGFCPRYIVRQPTGLSGVVVVLKSNTWFEGKVTGPDGKPAPFAQVRADQGPKQSDGVMITSVWTETETDQDGNYKLLVQPDAYDVQVRVPGIGAARTGKIAITEGQARHLDIPLITGITFRAKVVDSLTSQPVAGVRLYSNEHAGVEGRSDANGDLVVPFMEPGRFTFDVDARQYARWWSDQAASEWNRRQTIDRAGKWQRNFDDLDFDLAEKMPAVTIVVEKQVTIRGKVVDPDGLPVSGATVAPALTGTGNSLTGDTRFSVTTDAGGNFIMTLPASGDHDYNLVAHDGKYRRWRKWANGILPPLRTTPGQEMDDVTLTLTRPAIVRGRVVDSDGNPIPGREVRAQAADLCENRYYDPTVRTDKDGNFVLKFVRPGEQFIQVAPFSLTASEAPKGTSKTVTLTAGQTLEDVDFTANPNDR